MSLSKASGVAYTTIRSMIERDLANASIDNVLKLCAVLDIKAEDLNKSSDLNKDGVETIAAHHEGEDWSEEEEEKIRQFKDFVKSQRK